jgi:hypothetical protein
MFLKPKNLENMRVNSLINLVAKKRLGIALNSPSQKVRRHRGTVRV